MTKTELVNRIDKLAERIKKLEKEQVKSKPAVEKKED